MTNKIRVRYAPSPTGLLHIGNARTALFNYLYARHHGGDFIIRIEDTDRKRHVEDGERSQLENLRWLGMDWDESPETHENYRQSERLALYKKYIDQLLAEGKAYKSYVTEEELAAERERQEAAGETPRYINEFLGMSADEKAAYIAKRQAAGIVPTVRLKVNEAGIYKWHDMVKGDIEFEGGNIGGDWVIQKKDGYPTYNFANVVDDHLMGITHVVRGNEYLSSSPKYNRLYDAFGWEVPVYVHCPLITDENHHKLSKRSGHSSFEDLIDQGFVSEAVVNYVALLGWSPEGNQEIFSLEDMIREFDYRRMSKSPAVFDMTKLRWMNGEYIKSMDFDRFYEMAEPYIRRVIKKDLDLKKIAAMVKTRIEVFPDIEGHIDFFETLPEYDTAMYTHKKMKTNSETSLQVLKDVLPLLEAQEDFSNDALYELLSKYVSDTGVKTGFVMWPIRTAVSGKQMTPAGATEIMEVLGKEESLARIRRGIELLEA